MVVTAWNLDPPPGSQGLHSDKPVTVYRRHLPHWRQEGATYFVTFWLADALPQSKLRELDALKREWEKKLANADDQSLLNGQWAAYSRLVMQQVESWLDQGMGDCWLRQPTFAQIVAESLHYFDGVQYELGCYVVMPNHVHTVLRPLSPTEWPLEKILQSRKRHTSHEIQMLLGRRTALWQDESFDRIVRDAEHLYRCVQYVGSNARRAGLPTGVCLRWIRPEWERLGWRFEDT
jgi:hypothetical protein